MTSGSGLPLLRAAMVVVCEIKVKRKKVKSLGLPDLEIEI
jgi:hypothetical protein